MGHSINRITPSRPNVQDLRPGDKVTVEYEVAQLSRYSPARDRLVARVVTLGGLIMDVDDRSVVSHTPRSLKVGDIAIRKTVDGRPLALSLVATYPVRVRTMSDDGKTGAFSGVGEPGDLFVAPLSDFVRYDGPPTTSSAANDAPEARLYGTFR
jgi:hypothetical protein